GLDLAEVFGVEAICLHGEPELDGDIVQVHQGQAMGGDRSQGGDLADFRGASQVAKHHGEAGVAAIGHFVLVDDPHDQPRTSRNRGSNTNSAMVLRSTTMLAVPCMPGSMRSGWRAGPKRALGRSAQAM